MAKEYSKAELAGYWFDMYMAQDFDLTVRELRVLWGLSTTSAVHYRLRKMYELGLVKRKKSGSTYIYRAKHEREIDWIQYYEIGGLTATHIIEDEWPTTFMDAAKAGLIEEGDEQ